MARQNTNAHNDHLVQAIRSMAELSSENDHLVMIEYSEPQPLMFMNQGMGAFFINWINPAPGEKDCPLSYSISPLGPKPPEGVNRVLAENELMPLMGRLKTGDQMMSLCTPLYNTPLFKHEAPLTDYLLIIKMEKCVCCPRLI